MPRVTLPLDSLRPGRLPPVCVVTGEREAVTWLPMHFTWSPPAASLAHLAGPLGGLASVLLARRARGWLPFSARGTRRRRLAGVALALSLVWALLSFMVGVFLVTARVGLERHGLAVLVTTVAVPLWTWMFVFRRGRVAALHIDDRVLILAIPSEEAARTMALWVEGRLPPAGP